MTVGGGNGSVIISRGWDKKYGWRPYYSAFVDSNGWQQGTDKFTLRKVGTGAITEYGVQSVYNFSLEGGSINLGAKDVYTGPYTRLTVANATLGIAAATTVASVSFESGAIIRQAIAVDGDTYTCPTLTITGNVNVTGLVCDLVDANSFLENAQATDENLPTFTLLEATSVTGKPTGTVEMATSGWGWQAKVRESNTKLVMIPGPTNPGLIIIFR